MKLAIVGCRNCPPIDIASCLSEISETIVSGGAKDVDTYAKNFANKNKIPLIEFLPEYEKYGRQAPILRNIKIVENSDSVLAFWDGKSPGTKFTIDYAKRKGKSCKIIWI